MKGAKYSGDGLVGWSISVQTNPHEPSSEYWVSGRDIREATVGVMPSTLTSGSIVAPPELEQEAIFAAIGQWEKGLLLSEPPNGSE
ncbi:MAG TPA: hypothetical protein VFE38_08305 [Edaphobacter sp.]|nr:hypothetical protein [Edaphobacter sp.]